MLLRIASDYQQHCIRICVSTVIAASGVDQYAIRAGGGLGFDRDGGMPAKVQMAFQNKRRQHCEASKTLLKSYPTASSGTIVTTSAVPATHASRKNTRTTEMKLYRQEKCIICTSGASAIIACNSESPYGTCVRGVTMVDKQKDKKWSTQCPSDAKPECRKTYEEYLRCAWNARQPVGPLQIPCYRQYRTIIVLLSRR